MGPSFASRRSALLALALLSVACKSSGIPSDARTTVLSFQDLDGGDGGDGLARALIQLDGVYRVAFDKRKAELSVLADPGVAVFALAQANKPKDEAWTLVEGAGKGRYLAWEAAPTGADVVEVAKDGEDVPDLAPHLAKGKITLVDFSAKWCDPCRELDAHVMKLLEARPDLAYRKLDVGDWDTPLGKRYLTGVKALPHVIVFDAAGNRVAALSGLDLPGLDAALAKAKRGAP